MKSRRFLFIAKHGLSPILTALLLGGIFLVYSIYRHFLPCLLVSIFCFLFSFFCVLFFRDPERRADSDSKGVLAPADGKVIELIDSSKELILGESKTEFKKISIFMSVFNVHVNRIPWDGRVKLVEYRSGKFYPADKTEASERNECNLILIEDENSKDKFLVKQIAGIIARRIVCWVKTGDVVQKGERFGMIKFGSRVELFMPKDFGFTVKIGDKVKAGATIVGRKN